MMHAPPERGRILPPPTITLMTTRFVLAAVLSGLVLISPSCRKANHAKSQDAGPPAVLAPALQSNNLASLPGTVYHNQADSPIHWQPWTKETLKLAKDAKRLVFAVIVLPQYPGFQKVLSTMAHDPAMVSTIHDHYVPVLIDGDAAREVGLLTADLCSEVKKRLQLPLFLWMTYDGNPVAWIPANRTDPAGVTEVFGQAHEMVARMWAESPEYVLKNSVSDNANRRKHMALRKNANVMSTQPAVEVVHCIRQLTSLYDPSSRTFDEIGGLFPSSAIELLATAAVHPGLPPEVRNRAMDTTREVLDDLLSSAMFDPLDGGMFPSRRGNSWALPTFIRDCQGEARAAVALIQAYRATHDAQVLQKALGVLAFAEKSYATREGLFAVGLTTESAAELWMWNVEDIAKELPPEDVAWWIKATAMQPLGNLPSETDPHRNYFRCNTLGLTQSMAEIAASLGQSPATFAPRFEAAKAKLLAVRNARIGTAPRDEVAHAGATFRMVSAYAAAFGATGDEAYRTKATSLLERARNAFAVGSRLRNFAQAAPESIGAGRAFLYALALQAVIDVAAITSDDHWLTWSEDLSTTSAELFTSNEFLKECPDEAKLIDLPVTDLIMFFDDSTAGLVSMDECRLAELGRPLVRSFSQLATPMPVYAMERPVLHTDLLLATMARHYPVTVVLGANTPPDLKLATERLQMRVIQHRPARAADQVPDGSVKVLLPQGESRMVTTPAALQEALLPSPAK